MFPLKKRHRCVRYSSLWNARAIFFPRFPFGVFSSFRLVRMNDFRGYVTEYWQKNLNGDVHIGPSLTKTTKMAFQTLLHSRAMQSSSAKVKADHIMWDLTYRECGFRHVGFKTCNFSASNGNVLTRLLHFITPTFFKTYNFRKPEGCVYTWVHCVSIDRGLRDLTCDVAWALFVRLRL